MSPLHVTIVCDTTEARRQFRRFTYAVARSAGLPALEALALAYTRKNGPRP
jgi:hypothetical protein